MVGTVQVFGRCKRQMETRDLTVLSACEFWKGLCLPQSEDAHRERSTAALPGQTAHSWEGLFPLTLWLG